MVGLPCQDFLVENLKLIEIVKALPGQHFPPKQLLRRQHHTRIYLDIPN